MNEKIREAFDLIERGKDEYLQFLTDVCEIESPTDCKAGVDRVGEYFLAKARERGFKTEVFPLEGAGNVVAITLNPESPEAPFCLSAHLDTVHPLGLFGTPAVRIEGDRMIGPGVFDDKGGAVCGFWVMDVLQKIGYRKRPVILLLQSDEETSSKESDKHSVEYICERAAGAVGFLNLEPNADENCVTIARKGISELRFTIRGVAAHGACCNEGANALAEAAYKILELEKYKDPEGITMSCNVAAAGKAFNTVPDRCEIGVDARFATEEQYAEIRRAAEQIAGTVHIAGTSCEVEEVSYRPSMPLTETNAAWLDRINGWLADAGLDRLEGVKRRGGSDAAYITRIGVPVIDSIGPVGGNPHARDEYISISQYTLSPKRILTVAWNV